MTLLEALVVVAITALLSALAFPMFHAQSDAAHLKSGSHALVADLRRARAAAILLDRPVTLTPVPDGWSWDGGADHLDARLRLTAQQPVTFYPDGSATAADLTLGAAGNAAHVAVDPTTGHVSLARR